MSSPLIVMVSPKPIYNFPCFDKLSQANVCIERVSSFDDLRFFTQNMLPQDLLIAIESSTLNLLPIDDLLLKLPLRWLVAGKIEQSKLPHMLLLDPELQLDVLKTFLRLQEKENIPIELPLDACVLEGWYCVQSIEKSKKLIIRLSEFAPKKDSVVMGLMELMINAIEHGNLGIGFDEKSLLNQNGDWMQEVQKRLQQSPFTDLFVQVHYEKKQEKIVYTITDQGKGFDLSKVRSPVLPSAALLHGRGIVMAKEIAFDSLTYIEPGNQVRAEVFFK